MSNEEPTRSNPDIPQNLQPFEYYIPDALAMMRPGEPSFLFDGPGVPLSYRHWAMVRDWMLLVEKRLFELEGGKP